MSRWIRSVRFINPGAPGNQRRPRIVRMSIPVTPPITHPMVRSKNPGGSIIPIKVVDEFDGCPDSVIDDFNVAQVFFGIGAVGVACGIEAKEMQKEHVFVSAEGGVEGTVCGGVFEEM